VPPSISNFFEKRARFPRFKRRRGSQSSHHYTGKIGFATDWVSIPKLPGRINAVVHRTRVGRLKSITLTKTATGKYFASLLVDDGVNAPEPPLVIPQDTILGVDVDLTHVAIESDGRMTDNPKFVRRAQRNLRRKQRALSRKQKGSRNLAKAMLIVAAAHERVSKCARRLPASIITAPGGGKPSHHCRDAARQEYAQESQTCAGYLGCGLVQPAAEDRR
jgi:putative transposase